ncbi:MAG: hypothetical protein KDB27_07970 [Planctomycetales bacterium]|nr:hypothetical protein [Planctomycetales bacterium]
MNNSTFTDQPVERQTETLKHVVDHVEQFLLTQVERIEQELLQIESCTAELSNQASCAPAPSSQEGDSECNAKRLELEEDCQRLAEAWERVENEQRQMLAAQSIQQAIGGASRVTAGDGPSDLKGKIPTSLNPITGPSKSPQSGRNPASMTFKQLQQQIRAHNKRRK